MPDCVYCVEALGSRGPVPVPLVPTLHPQIPKDSNIHNPAVFDEKATGIYYYIEDQII